MDRIRAKTLHRQRGGSHGREAKAAPRTTQEALKQFACLGNIAEIATLALVLGETEDEVHVALWEAVHAGLVLRQESAYTFLHDRIQQAAYSLIPDEDVPRSTCASAACCWRA